MDKRLKRVLIIVAIAQIVVLTSKFTGQIKTDNWWLLLSPIWGTALSIVILAIIGIWMEIKDMGKGRGW